MVEKGRNKTNEKEKINIGKRRRILKALATGTGAVATVKLAPEKWTKPVVDSVLLPAHAQTTVVPTTAAPTTAAPTTTAAPLTYAINCASSNDGLTCQIGGNGELIVELNGNITGTGPDLTGAVLNVDFTAIVNPQIGSGGTETVSDQMVVDSSGAFSGSFAITPTLGATFIPPVNIDITFDDPATFGSDTCTLTWTCT